MHQQRVLQSSTCVQGINYVKNSHIKRIATDERPMTFKIIQGHQKKTLFDWLYNFLLVVYSNNITTCIISEIAHDCL